MVWDNKGNQSDWSDSAYWEMGLISPAEWSAQWIARKESGEVQRYQPCPMLRKEFEIRGKVKSARIYATALGLYYLELNGRRVSDWYFTPGWTSYNKRLQYQTYDVTSLLKEGRNATGAVLGDGWLRGDMTWDKNRNTYGSRTALLFQMHIDYEDGSNDIITSDGSWRVSSGPILMSEIYHGERYDARLEKDGWSMPRYDDREWGEVEILEHTKETLIAQENEPVKIAETIKPIELIKTPAGETVIDMGQNMVGWVRFRVQGERGTQITLKHAEVLDKEGNFYTDNLRKAEQTVQYTVRGTGWETYEPHFTFQGFRYVKVEGYPGELSLENFTGVVLHSGLELTGSFECSNPLVNQLQHNILWGQKGNFLEVPTDCPQRDERLGWTGDAQVFIRTACFNMNVATFFSKWLKDLKSDQLENGGVPYVIPNVLKKDQHSSAAWGDAATICPWTVYICYGDKRVLEQQYDSMKAWVEYIRSQGSDEFLWNTGFHYGDWLALDAKENSYMGATPKDYIATAFYAYSTGILKQTAEILGRTDDVEEYGTLYNKIIESFHREFVTPNGRLASPTQTAHVLALMFDLVKPEHRQRVLDDLVELIHENNDHLTTGFVGTPYLCLVLSHYGHNELAYKLILQEDYPSWLYPITKGATTIWEHWDGIKEDGSFWSPAMNSFNHYAYGSIGDWLYRVVCGIDTDIQSPGYRHIHIKPQPGPGFSYAKAAFKSMYGEIKSSWEDSGDELKISITIPANTTASVVLPSAQLDDVREGTVSLDRAEGIISCSQSGQSVQLELGSGDYVFTYPK
jgi:alpha-L-rhamnosidase